MKFKTLILVSLVFFPKLRLESPRLQAKEMSVEEI